MVVMSYLVRNEERNPFEISKEAKDLYQTLKEKIEDNTTTNKQTL